MVVKDGSQRKFFIIEGSGFKNYVPYVCEFQDTKIILETEIIDQNHMSCITNDLTQVSSGAYTLLVGLKANQQFFRAPPDIIVVD